MATVAVSSAGSWFLPWRLFSRIMLITEKVFDKQYDNSSATFDLSVFSRLLHVAHHAVGTVTATAFKNSHFQQRKFFELCVTKVPMFRFCRILQTFCGQWAYNYWTAKWLTWPFHRNNRNGEPQSSGKASLACICRRRRSLVYVFKHATIADNASHDASTEHAVQVLLSEVLIRQKLQMRVAKMTFCFASFHFNIWRRNIANVFVCMHSFQQIRSERADGIVRCHMSLDLIC